MCVVVCGFGLDVYLDYYGVGNYVNYENENVDKG